MTEFSQTGRFHAVASMFSAALFLLSFSMLAEGAQLVGGPTTSANAHARSYGHWTLRCAARADGGDRVARDPAVVERCEIAQGVTAVDGGKSVQLLEIAVSRAGDKTGKRAWALVVLAPLDVLLAPGLGLEEGHRRPVVLRYRNCNHLGCFAVAPLTEEMLAGLRKEIRGAAYFRLLNGRAVKVIFSLDGFSKAFSALASGKGLPSGDDGAADPVGRKKRRK